MAEIIAVSNQKGGVGKTTTSVNVAACLGAAGFKTLLVDMDPQANATSAIGVSPHDLENSIYQNLLNLSEPSPIDLTERCANLYLLPGTEDLAGAEIELLDADDRDMRLKSVLEKRAGDAYDFIIIDSPPSLSLLTLNVLNAAQWALIPVQSEYLALDGLTRIINIIQRVQQGSNPDLQLLGVALTLYDGRTRLAQEVQAELEKVFGPKLFKTRIVRTVRLSEAPSHGLPIIYYDFNSPGAKCYIHLCEEIIDVCQEAGTRPRA